MTILDYDEFEDCAPLSSFHILFYQFFGAAPYRSLIMTLNKCLVDYIFALLVLCVLRALLILQIFPMSYSK